MHDMGEGQWVRGAVDIPRTVGDTWDQGAEGAGPAFHWLLLLWVESVTSCHPPKTCLVRLKILFGL